MELAFLKFEFGAYSFGGEKANWKMYDQKLTLFERVTVGFESRIMFGWLASQGNS